MQLTTLAVDLLQLSANYSYNGYVNSVQATETTAKLLSFDSRFSKQMGNVSVEVTSEQIWDFVHEAGVYSPATNAIYATSQSGTTANPINMTVIDPKTFKMLDSYQVPGLMMPNGGAKYNDTHLVFCVFGSNDVPSTLTLFEPKTRETSVLLSSFYGRNFSSLNDVRVHPDGSVWFTDDMYGFYEGFRPDPVMPTQVYRYDPKTGATRVVADHFDQPNGLEFSVNNDTLYINDSGYVHQPGNFNGSRANTIYAYDMVKNGTSLANRRVFAYGANPFVDGMHVDAQGWVWATSNKGVTAWDEDGVPLGEIRVPTDVNNFMFVPDGILLLGYSKLYHVVCGMRPKPVDMY